MSGLVYLIQPPECIGTNCYKVGMSQSNTIRRIRSYGYDCINIVSRECANPIDVERELIALFQFRFGNPVQGREWFSGSKREMIRAYDECFATHAEYVDDNLVATDFPKLPPLERFIKGHTALTCNRLPISIDAQHYELLNILPNEWFTQSELFIKVIHAVRNSIMIDEDRVSTVRQLFLDRFLWYNEQDLLEAFNSCMDSTQQRFGIPALSKLIKASWPKLYQKWYNKWKLRKPQAKTGFRYKYGSSATLADIKALQRGITAKKLLEINSHYTAYKLKICKHCHNKHLVGCCEKYKRVDYTTSTIIANIELV